MVLAKHTDEEIIKGCKAGKRYFQNQLYEKYKRSLFSVCLRYAVNMQEAEDILQESFCKIFTHIGDYKGQGSFEGWLKRIVINSTLSYLKQNKKDPLRYNNIEKIEHVAEEEVEDEDDIFSNLSPQQCQTILKFIQELPVGYRTVFNLYVFEGYSHQQIAQILQISENTSKSQLSKARRHLKNKILQWMEKGITTNKPNSSY